MTSSIPVITLTAHTMAGARDRALDSGVGEMVVSKSDFDRNKFKDLITELVNQSLVEDCQRLYSIVQVLVIVS